MKRRQRGFIVNPYRYGSSTPQPTFSNVSLLLHMDARPFMDASNNNHPVAHYGAVSLETSTKKFGAGAYQGSTNVGLQVLKNTAFVFGTGHWMMDAWVNRGSSAEVKIFDQRLTTVNNNGFVFFVSTAGAVAVALNGTTYGTSSPAATVGTSTWTHVAASYDGTNVRTFVDGVLATTAAASPNLTVSNDVWIGNTDQHNDGKVAYMDDLRIVKGEAVYTAAFSPPTSAAPDAGGGIIAAAPAGTYANVKALLHFESALTDNSGSPKTYTARGSAAASGTQFKYGSQSLSLNGSSQWIDTPAVADWDFGTGDFTLEAWVRPTNFTNTGSIWSTYVNPGGWLLDILATSGFPRLFFDTAAVLTSANAATTAAWNHIAGCRISGVLYLYLNGELQGMVANTSVWDSTTALHFGQLRTSGPANYFNGYLDEGRILKGEGVYPRSFVVPAAAFADS